MKTKLFLSLFLFAISFSLIAKDDNTNKNMRPKAGDKSFEVDFLPFSQDGPIRLTALRGRYFIQDQIAINLNINFSNKKLHNETPYVRDDYMLFDTEDAKTNVFGIGLGIEYHFLKTGRVSPYAGFQIGFEMKSSSYESLNNHYENYGDSFTTTETEIENAWGYSQYGYDQYGNPYYYTGIQERAYNAFKANLVLGADVYILKHFYMGVELGLGYSNLNFKEVIVKEDSNIELKFPKATESNFGFVYNNAIRLGFWF